MSLSWAPLCTLPGPPLSPGPSTEFRLCTPGDVPANTDPNPKFDTMTETRQKTINFWWFYSPYINRDMIHLQRKRLICWSCGGSSSSCSTIWSSTTRRPTRFSVVTPNPYSLIEHWPTIHPSLLSSFSTTGNSWLHYWLPFLVTLLAKYRFWTRSRAAAIGQIWGDCVEFTASLDTKLSILLTNWQKRSRWICRIEVE